MDLPESRIREIIEECEADIDEYEAELENEDPKRKRVARLHRFIASNALSIGLYYLELDEPEDAWAWFARSARERLEYYRAYERYGMAAADQTHWESEPGIMLDVLYTALLSRDDELIVEMAEAPAAMDPEYPEEHPHMLHRYHYVKALVAVIEGRDPTESLEAMREAFEGVRQELREYFSAFGTVLAGIAAGDPAETERGLELVVAEHEDQFSGDPGIITEHVDYRTTALVVLAKRAGVDLAFESAYVPACAVADE